MTTAPPTATAASHDDEAIRDAASHQLEVLRRLAPHSLEAHARYLHRDDEDKPIVAAEHHTEWIRILEDAERFPWVVVVAPPGFAKALADHEPVFTPNGWRLHGSLEVGDEVFAPDGSPRKILATKRWALLRPCMRVDFSDGSSVIADELHEWKVLCDRERYRSVGRRKGPRGAVKYVRGSRSHKRVEEILETRELLVDQRRPPAIPVAKALQFPERALPLDPYLLGAWLGDGTTGSGSLTIGHGDLDHFRHLGKVTVFPSNSRAARIQVPGLTSRLREIGLLGEKRIPIDFLLASEAQRLALLQGLMDTDGTIAESGHAAFSTVREELAHQVRDLICSLGMKASTYTEPARYNDKPTGRIAYRVAFHPDRSVFRLPRKAKRCKTKIATRTKCRYITAVEPCGDYPAKCISVEGGMYLAGRNLVPTHNSTWFSLIYPTWELGRSKGKLRVGVVGNAGSQAGAWVSAIGDAVELPAFHAAYPHEGTIPDKTRGWSKSQFYLKGTPKGNNPACLASGMKGVSVLGKRFDRIILDDPTTGDNARSKTEMESQRDWLKKTLLSRFPPGKGPPDGEGGRMVVVCTRWSENDLVPTLEEKGFVVVRMPALGYPDRIVHCPECGYTGVVTGDPETDTPPHSLTRCTVPDALLEVIEYGEESLWPERISEAQLLAQAEEDPLVFELVMQGNATALAGEFFDPAWFRYGNLPARDQFDKVVQFVDTAGGKDRKKGDYFVIVTLGKIGDDFWVMDVVRDRLSALRQEDAVKAAAEKWDPNHVLIEDKNEGIALVQRLSVNTQLPIKPYTPVKDKEFRAAPVAAKYRVGHVYHPGTVDESGIRVAKWVRRLETEMKAFPESRHDDQVDALSGAFNSLGVSGPRVRVLG